MLLLFSKPKFNFPIIDDLADDFALLIVNVKRKLRSLSDSQLQDVQELVEEKVEIKGRTDRTSLVLLIN